MFLREIMWVSERLGGVFLALPLLMSCASSQATATDPSSDSPSTPDDEVYKTFVGTDAQAMAQLGQRIERERPPLKSELVEKMLAFLKDHSEDGPPLQMLRPMLFRSVAVVVGQPAAPILQRCATEAPGLAQLCQDTLQELSDAPKQLQLNAWRSRHVARGAAQQAVEALVARNPQSSARISAGSRPIDRLYSGYENGCLRSR